MGQTPPRGFPGLLAGILAAPRAHGSDLASGRVNQIKPGGSPRDAQWHSFSVNALHGYPRKDADIAKIMGRIFSDAEWQDMPVRAIADHVGVSKSAVFYYRDAYLYNAKRKTAAPTLSTCGQSSHDASEIQPREPASSPEWRQTDIEEFTGSGGSPRARA